MKKLAAFIVSGRLVGAACCASFASLAILIPLALILANASVVLHTLCKGLRSSLLMVLAATLFLFLWFVVLHQWTGADKSFAENYLNAMLFIFLLWLPFLLLAWVLRITRSMSLVFHIMAVSGVVGVLIITWLIEDPAAFWDAIFAPMLRDEFMQAIRDDAVMQQSYQEALGKVTSYLTASALLFALSSMLLGRWWQSLLYNLGGFRKEFLGLQLGRLYAVTVIVLLLLAHTFEWPLAQDFYIVLMTPLMFQGIATVHFFLAVARRPDVWLRVFYIAFVLAVLMFPILTFILLALLAVAEALFNWRHKTLAV